MKTLGDKLKDILAERDAQYEASREAVEEARAKKRLLSRNTRIQLISSITEEIKTSLDRGVIPCHKVYTKNNCDWITSCNKYETRGVTDLDLWDDMIRWLNSEDMRLKVTSRQKEKSNLIRTWLEISVDLL